MEKEIVSILVDGQGWYKAEYGKIEVFYENGEMALVKWFRHGNKEFNGKYVIMIHYKDIDEA